MTEIPLARGYMAMFDDEDAELVSAYKWRVLVQSHTAYAIARLPNRGGKQRTLYLHRLVMGAKPGDRVSHVDKNGLNATKHNLRIQNSAPDIPPPVPASPPTSK